MEFWGLTSKELNQFGKIANEPFFSSITEDSFTSKEFENISWNKHGVSILVNLAILWTFEWYEYLFNELKLNI